MNVTTLLSKETIHLSLEAGTKEECIAQMADSLAKTGVLSNKDQFVEAVIQREAVGSTGVGFGFAIPHGKSAGVAQPGLAFARLTQPLDWQSIDGQDVNMLFMIAVPEEKAGNEHLQILAALSRKLIHEEFRNRLAQAQSAEEIMDILHDM